VVDPAIPLVVVAAAIDAPVVGGVPELPSVDQASPPAGTNGLPFAIAGLLLAAAAVVALGVRVARRNRRAASA